ncbi:MAG: histidine triad nucleotide-binding protein [Anaerolineales bacterium]
MDECIFCKIVRGEMDATIVYKDDQVTAFRDINPVAPTHILVVPNQHIASTNEVSGQDEQLLGHMLTVVKPIADEEGITNSGYRLIINTGPDANQVVFHLHLHILGGHPMQHRMG